MYFAAVELRLGEVPQDGVRYFLSVAADQGIRFKHLRTFGPFEFACVRFIRFQTDCPTFPPIIARMQTDGRAIIAPSKVGYRAFLAKGREGPVQTMLMHTTALPGHSKTFVGTTHPHWAAQFTQDRPATAEDPRDPEAGEVS